MTLGLLGGLVGAAAGTAAGVAGLAVGTAAGVAGAALNVGAQVVGTALNIADAMVLELASFAVKEHCKAVGPTLRLGGVVDARVTDCPGGKTYTFVLQVEVNIGGIWLVKTHRAVVTVPFIGLPGLELFECIEGGY